jgi:long-chain acyl-CoA synthetase
MSKPQSAQKPWPVMSIAQAHALMTRPGSPFEMEEVLIRGVKMRVWKHAPPTLREVFLQGRTHGDKIFLVYENDRASFDAFSKAALAIADELVNQGVKKGDRVVLAMRNLPEWAAIFFGILLAGAVATPLNAWWTGAELEYGLKDSDAKIAFVDAERLERIVERLPNCIALEKIYVARSAEEITHPRVVQLETVTGAVNDWHKLPDRPLPDVTLAPDDDATIFYTSGTTGKPKGALGTHRNATSTVVAATFSPARNFIRRGEMPPMSDPKAPQKANLLAVPFFHTTGCHAVLCPALFNGIKLVLLRRWDAELAMQMIERERVTSTGGVPTIAWQLIEHPARKKYDLSSLEVVSYGGAPAASELVRRIKQVFPKSIPGLGWGMTETSATFTHNGGEDYEHRPESSGPALPVCEMKIIGETGETLPTNALGELWAKGPNVVKGYWNNPAATAETFVDGWLKTGDIAKIDEEGFCYIVDRKKDMLLRGGENIYCIEVEDVLYQHPAVMDAAVVGIAHRILGEEPGAVVTLKPDTEASEEELRAFVAERLAAFKVPIRVVFWPEMLPRNPSGKILKTELKKVFTSSQEPRT